MYTNRKMADFTSILTAPMPIQNFDFSHILEYCDVVNASHGSTSDYRKYIIKEKHLLKEKFVTGLRFKVDENDNFVVKGKVKAEMKKRSSYDVSCTIEKTGKVSPYVDFPLIFENSTVFLSAGSLLNPI